MTTDKPLLDDAPPMSTGDEVAAHLSPRESTIVYRVAMLQGFGLLLSWNVVLNVVPYFQSLYNDSGVSFYITRCAGGEGVRMV